MCEGYDADFKHKYGKSDRTVLLKSGAEVSDKDIHDVYRDESSVMDISGYLRWTMLGFARDWADVPNRFVQVVEMLKPLDDLYHPRMQL